MSKSLKKTSRMVLGIDMPEAPRYPAIFVDKKQMPEIESWKVGETYNVEFKIKMVGKQDYPGHTPSADIDLINYRVIDKNPAHADKKML